MGTKNSVILEGTVVFLTGTPIMTTAGIQVITDTVSGGIWNTSGAPVLTTGIGWLTFTAGASTYRIPIWSTT